MMMDFSELPLVIFTTLSQMAVGAYVTMYLLGRSNHIGEKTISLTSKIVVVLMALAMAGASTHLGDPLGGPRALLGLTHSWLSREIFLMGFFLGLAFLYALPQLQKVRRCLGFCGSVAGILGIIATAMVYTLPARPAWNTAYPMMFFFLTALAAGPLLTAFIAGKAEGRVCKPALQMAELLLLLELLVTVFYPITQGANLNMPMGWLAVRCAVGQLIPAVMLHRQAAAAGEHNLLLPLLLVIAGELLGHQLFYASVLPYPLFPQ